MSSVLTTASCSPSASSRPGASAAVGSEACGLRSRPPHFLLRTRRPGPHTNPRAPSPPESPPICPCPAQRSTGGSETEPEGSGPRSSAWTRGPHGGLCRRHCTSRRLRVLSCPHAARTGPHPGRHLLGQVSTLQPASQHPQGHGKGGLGAPGMSESTVWGGARESVLPSSQVYTDAAGPGPQSENH